MLLHIYSVITLLGRPLHQLFNANIKSANRVVVTKCIQACRYSQEVQLFFRPNVRMGKTFQVILMIVGARQGGLSLSLTADLLGVSCTTVSRVCR